MKHASSPDTITSPEVVRRAWRAPLQKRSNPHLANKNEAEFVALRSERDKILPMPKLILHALQVNIAGGRLPDPEANGTRYLKIPLDALAGAAGG